MKAYIGPDGAEDAIIEIDDYDTWNADVTLAAIIIPVLKKLKEVQQSRPLVDNEDVPEHLQHDNLPRCMNLQKDMLGDREYDDLVWEKLDARWEWVLDEMIWAFSQKLIDWEQQYYSGKVDYRRIPVDEKGNKVEESEASFFSLEETEKSTFSVDWEKWEAHKKRMTHGFYLFGKYFENLWD